VTAAPWKILHGDCLAEMEWMANESVDSIVTDPPYDLTARKKGGSGLASVNLDSPYGRSRIGTGNGTGGFMGMHWDSTGIAFDPATWVEALRVLKPGGHVLAFGGTRTYHRMACAIEDAGFEIRDQIGWTYGSGFPKSHNGPWGGTALKPAWEPIVMARKPIVGTVAQNFERYGVGGLNVDGCRVPTEDNLNGGAYAKEGQERTDDWGAHNGFRRNQGLTFVQPEGRHPANLIHDGSDEVLAAFPQAPGQQADASATAPSGKTGRVYGSMNREADPMVKRKDAGSAARFFYQSKANKKDREAGNLHPTVKPTDLMRYLCRLVTPRNGLVFDPFMGSGSTGKAALLEGFRFVGIEREAEYINIARARLERAEQEGEL
jgi:site-specific DNA-methyltransferase (adenine-specific)